NLRPWPSSRFRRFARAVSDLGIDVFHGHSAHLLQGVEVSGGRVILYDTGDFLDDYWVFPGIRTDRSCVFLADFVGGKFHRLRVVPVILRPGQVRLARGKEACGIATRMLRRSRPYLLADQATLTEFSFRPGGRTLSPMPPSQSDPDASALDGELLTAAGEP